MVPKSESSAEWGKAGGEQASLEIRRGPEGIFVEGLTTVPVDSAKQVLEVLEAGNKAPLSLPLPPSLPLCVCVCVCVCARARACVRSL